MGLAAILSVFLLAPSAPASAQAAEPLPPGRYCAYEPVDTVSPPGEVWTRVIVEQRDGAPYVSFANTWPHSDRILAGEGPAEVGANGVLRFEFDGGWGNDVVVGLLHPDGRWETVPQGEAPDDWASNARAYMFSDSQVSAADCRPSDLEG